MRWRRTTPARSDRGSASLELSILALGLLAVFSLLIAGGRLAMARTSVEDAANAAARAASISRSAEGARTEASAVADATLRGQNVRCVTRSIEVNTGGFSAPIGVPAAVTTRVDCTVDLSDVALPGLPGSMTLSAEGRSAIDQYRERR